MLIIIIPDQPAGVFLGFFSIIFLLASSWHASAVSSWYFSTVHSKHTA
jgi:hypothetical protein